MRSWDELKATLPPLHTKNGRMPEGLAISAFGFQISDFLQISDFGFRISGLPFFAFQYSPPPKQPCVIFF
jgi:hypothetical protein